MSKTLVRCISLFCAFAMLASMGGVWAVWTYANRTPDSIDTKIFTHMNEFSYAPDMPEGEVSLLHRIGDLLNNIYSNDIISEGQAREYLLSTLDKNWDIGHSPTLGSFVGNMDPTTESQARINAMFGDIFEFNSVSFILKSEDLVGGVDDEIALYSTSDPLTWSTAQWTPMVVGVYLSVFVPITDAQGQIIGYELLCNSLHGYCTEVEYMAGSNIPSFSTDHWRDELYYWHELYDVPQPITGDDRYKYECYHPADGNYPYPGRSASWLGWINVQSNQWEVGDYMGKKAWQCLAEIMASRS